MTSRFERLGLSGKIIAIAILTVLPATIFPSAVFAQTVSKTPSLEINTINFTIPQVSDIQNILNPQPAVVPPTPKVDPNIAILQDYLTQKGSPLADSVETLLQQDNWKLVVAISNGESTMCKHEMYNNCWGIGGAWNLKRYDSLDDGIVDVNRILDTKYIPDGKTTPEQIVDRYVGHPNRNWVLAVNQILTEVNQLPLTN